VAAIDQESSLKTSPELIEAKLRSLFLARSTERSESEPGWLALVRKNAFERFLDKGFPTTRDEDWRFTNVGAIASRAFELASGGAEAEDAARTLLASLGLEALSRHELVFVNGQFSQELSSLSDLPDGVVVSSLESAWSHSVEELQPVLCRSPSDETAFFDLNEAFVTDGAFVHIGKGVVVDAPIHCVFLTVPTGEPCVHYPRNVIVAGEQSEVRIIETYAGLEGSIYFTNAVTQLVARPGSVVDHYKVQLESAKAFHVASLDFSQERGTSVSSHSLSIGAALARNDIRVELGGEGADVTLNGLYVVRGSQHVDHHTLIDHQVAHCTSRELYKGVLDDEASGVFNGRVIVRAGAQKTDAKQSNKNLLLSREALVNSNPQLEINADDVKCAHGATIGQLDEEALFYLRSRGIGVGEARKILTEGFMADVSDRIRVDAVRKALPRFLFKDAA